MKVARLWPLVILVVAAGAIFTWKAIHRISWVRFTSPDGEYSYVYPNTWESATRIFQDKQHLDKNENLEVSVYIPLPEYCKSLETCVMRRFHQLPSWMAFQMPQHLSYLRVTLPEHKSIHSIEYFVQQEDSPENVRDTYWVFQEGVLTEITYYSTISRQIDPNIVPHILQNFILDIPRIKSAASVMATSEWYNDETKRATWVDYSNSALGFHMRLPELLPQSRQSQAVDGSVSFLQFSLGQKCVDLRTCVQTIRDSHWSSRSNAEVYPLEVDGERATFTEAHENYQEYFVYTLHKGQLVQLSYTLPLIDTREANLRQAIFGTLVFDKATAS